MLRRKFHLSRIRRSIKRVIKCSGTARATSSMIKSGQKDTEASIMVPRENSTMAFSTELLNYIIAFVTLERIAGTMKYLTVDLVVSCLQR